MQKLKTMHGFSVKIYSVKILNNILSNKITMRTQIKLKIKIKFRLGSNLLV